MPFDSVTVSRSPGKRSIQAPSIVLPARHQTGLRLVLRNSNLAAHRATPASNLSQVPAQGSWSKHTVRRARNGPSHAAVFRRRELNLRHWPLVKWKPLQTGKVFLRKKRTKVACNFRLCNVPAYNARRRPYSEKLNFPIQYPLYFRNLWFLVCLDAELEVTVPMVRCRTKANFELHDPGDHLPGSYRCPGSPGKTIQRHSPAGKVCCFAVGSSSHGNRPSLLNSTGAGRRLQA